MTMLTVEIAYRFLEEAFRSGFQVRRTIVSKGLPEDAVLKYAGINRNGNLELNFSSESAGGEDRTVDIVLTVLGNSE